MTNSDTGSAAERLADLTGDPVDDFVFDGAIPSFEDSGLHELMDGAVSALARREDRALLGAWRAGYDYVHVFRHVKLGTPPTIHRYLPSNDAGHPRRLDEHEYAFTYDLTTTSDREILEAMRDD